MVCCAVIVTFDLSFTCSVVANEAGDSPFYLECISGDLKMIKCLDDGKGNLDSEYNC